MVEGMLLDTPETRADCGGSIPSFASSFATFLFSCVPLLPRPIPPLIQPSIESISIHPGPRPAESAFQVAPGTTHDQRHPGQYSPGAINYLHVRMSLGNGTRRSRIEMGAHGETNSREHGAGSRAQHPVQILAAEVARHEGGQTDCGPRLASTPVSSSMTTTMTMTMTMTLTLTWTRTTALDRTKTPFPCSFISKIHDLADEGEPYPAEKNSFFTPPRARRITRRGPGDPWLPKIPRADARPEPACASPVSRLVLAPSAQHAVIHATHHSQQLFPPQPGLAPTKQAAAVQRRSNSGAGAHPLFTTTHPSVATCRSGRRLTLMHRYPALAEAYPRAPRQTLAASLIFTCSRFAAGHSVWSCRSDLDVANATPLLPCHWPWLPTPQHRSLAPFPMGKTREAGVRP